MILFLYFIIAVIAGVIYASFFEWLLHKFVMHRPLFGFTYPFDAHAGTHHRIFKANATYHLQRDEDKRTIPMAWWNSCVLVPLATTPFFLFSILFLDFPSGVAVTFGGFFSIAAYYGAYEYLHWCMHLPRKRRLELGWVFQRLNGHHLLHHRYMHRNFNVVLPLADLCLFTLQLRSETRFAQPIHPAVPDVQPK
ncbi:MAG: fatty acid hydroxylase [bacterium]|nr:fatty acid hydroxylase [bacterium]